MKIVILGAGAIGSLLGGRLAASGADVTFVERGARARLLRRDGLTLLGPGDAELSLPRVRCVDADNATGRYDVLFLAVKAHEIDGALATLSRLLHEQTCVVTLQNGIPWWYFERGARTHAGYRIASVDPEGRIAAAIDAQRIVGCVAYPAAEIEPSGIVRHVEGSRFPLGEPDGTHSARAVALSALLEAAGLKAPILDDIRSEIWLKAWGNLSFNPVSALTGATMAEICRAPGTREVVTRMMQEAQQIAERLGARLRVSIERRLQGAEQVGHHKTSMLQDLEAGRVLELDALVGAVIELGRLTGAATPTIEAVHGLARLLDAKARSRGTADRGCELHPRATAQRP